MQALRCEPADDLLDVFVAERKASATRASRGVLDSPAARNREPGRFISDLQKMVVGHELNLVPATRKLSQRVKIADTSPFTSVRAGNPREHLSGGVDHIALVTGCSEIRIRVVGLNGAKGTHE